MTQSKQEGSIKRIMFETHDGKYREVAGTNFMSIINNETDKDCDYGKHKVSETTVTVEGRYSEHELYSNVRSLVNALAENLLESKVSPYEIEVKMSEAVRDGVQDAVKDLTSKRVDNAIDNLAELFMGGLLADALNGKGEGIEQILRSIVEPTETHMFSGTFEDLMNEESIPDEIKAFIQMKHMKA